MPLPTLAPGSSRPANPVLALALAKLPRSNFGLRSSHCCFRCPSLFAPTYHTSFRSLFLSRQHRPRSLPCLLYLGSSRVDCSTAVLAVSITSICSSANAFATAANASGRVLASVGCGTGSVGSGSWIVANASGRVLAGVGCASSAASSASGEAAPEGLAQTAGQGGFHPSHLPATSSPAPLFPGNAPRHPRQTSPAISAVPPLPPREQPLPPALPCSVYVDKPRHPAPGLSSGSTGYCDQSQYRPAGPQHR